jgi:hypothetical protein
MSFEQNKAARLKKHPMLRVLNAIGVISWSEGKYKTAEEKLRLVHPVTWLWVGIGFFVFIFMEGVPQGIREFVRACKEETCIW